MNTLVIVFVAVACLFGGIMADHQVNVVFSGSNSSTGGLLGCKPRSTSSVSGPKALIQFQAARTGGVEYSRVLVPSGRMTFNDVVATDMGSLTFPGCANAAKEKKWDAFSVENDQCVGYKIGDGICPCTTGDFVLYRASTAIRTPSSAKGTLGGTALPAGYIRKIIYPSVSLIGDNFMTSSSSCEDVLADLSIPSPLLLHTANGQCYYTQQFSSYPCDSCAGPATEVIVKKDFGTQTNLLSKCGGTITAPLYTSTDLASPTMLPKVLYSHEGYGCIPYPDPASDNNCDITLLAPAGSVALLAAAQSGSVDIDASAGTTCDGDELYVYFGPADGSPCKKSADISSFLLGSGDRVTIRFQRKPANNMHSFNMGFALLVYGLDFDPSALR